MKWGVGQGGRVDGRCVAVGDLEAAWSRPRGRPGAGLTVYHTGSGTVDVGAVSSRPQYLYEAGRTRTGMPSTRTPGNACQAANMGKE